MNSLHARSAAVALALFSSSCRAEHGVDAAVERASPHLDTFVRFVHWADQTSRSDVGLRTDAALAEATFATLRSDARVIAARVHGRVRGRVIELALPEPNRVPEPPTLVNVRNPELGTLRVASFEPCPIRDRAARPVGACVVLQTASVDTSQALAVAVVFRSTEP